MLTSLTKDELFILLLKSSIDANTAITAIAGSMVASRDNPKAIERLFEEYKKTARNAEKQQKEIAEEIEKAL